MKKVKTAYEMLGTTLNPWAVTLQGFWKEKGKRTWENIWRIIAENFPNMGKDIVNQVQEAQRVPGKINPRKNTLRHIVIKMTKIKDKDKIWNKGKRTNNIQGNSHKVISWFLNRNLAFFTSQKEWHNKFEVIKGKKPTTKNTLPSKTLVQIWWRNQKLSRQAKFNRIPHHETIVTTNVKGTSLGRKHKRRRRPTQNKPKIIKKTV